ncbi:MAG: aromatic amino acid lyase, partial [Betaproteobacteria bacterium]
MTLAPGTVTLAQWREIYHGTAPELDPACREGVRSSAATVDRMVAAGDPIYGVNTGFGKLSSVRIATEDLERLQRNIVLSHAAGVGDSTAPQVTRLMMALKLLSLAHGASGIRLATLDLLEAMLARDITPVVPA